MKGWIVLFCIFVLLVSNSNSDYIPLHISEQSSPLEKSFPIDANPTGITIYIYIYINIERSTITLSKTYDSSKTFSLKEYFNEEVADPLANFLEFREESMTPKCQLESGGLIDLTARNEGSSIAVRGITDACILGDNEYIYMTDELGNQTVSIYPLDSLGAGISIVTTGVIYDSGELLHAHRVGHMVTHKHKKYILFALDFHTQRLYYSIFHDQKLGTWSMLCLKCGGVGVGRQLVSPIANWVFVPTAQGGIRIFVFDEGVETFAEIDAEKKGVLMQRMFEEGGDLPLSITQILSYCDKYQDDSTTYELYFYDSSHYRFYYNKIGVTVDGTPQTFTRAQSFLFTNSILVIYVTDESALVKRRLVAVEETPSSEFHRRHKIYEQDTTGGEWQFLHNSIMDKEIINMDFGGLYYAGVKSNILELSPMGTSHKAFRYPILYPGIRRVYMLETPHTEYQYLLIQDPTHIRLHKITLHSPKLECLHSEAVRQDYEFNIIGLSPYCQRKLNVEEKTFNKACYITKQIVLQVVDSINDPGKISETTKEEKIYLVRLFILCMLFLLCAIGMIIALIIICTSYRNTRTKLSAYASIKMELGRSETTRRIRITEGDPFATDNLQEEDNKANKQLGFYQQKL